MCFILSIVDGTRAIPRATTSNSSGYSAKSIVSVEDPSSGRKCCMDVNAAHISEKYCRSVDL